MSVSRVSAFARSLFSLLLNLLLLILVPGFFRRVLSQHGLYTLRLVIRPLIRSFDLALNRPVRFISRHRTAHRRQQRRHERYFLGPGNLTPMLMDDSVQTFSINGPPIDLGALGKQDQIVRSAIGRLRSNVILGFPSHMPPIAPTPLLTRRSHADC